MEERRGERAQGGRSAFGLSRTRRSSSGSSNRSAAARIVTTLKNRIEPLDDPRSLGAPLKGEHEGYRRWRIGDYRVLERIGEERITILVARVAPRRQVYR